MKPNIQKIWNEFAAHYDHRLQNGPGEQRPLQELAPWPGYYYHHDDLRLKNGPRILYHDRYTKDVIVLTHGLTDSPYYLQAVAGCFFEEGCNVVMPLLPAHGQIRRKHALRKEELSEHWQDTLDRTVEIAHMLGERVSLGGFSTGGALSVNKLLRDRDQIQGGIFLFSGALSLGRLVDLVGNFEIIERVVDLFLDREHIDAESPDPYKYPSLPKACASELVDIIKDNKRRLGGAHQCGAEEDHRLQHPVFAAHSLHDETIPLAGVTDFMRDHVANGLLFPICDCVQHASVPLKKEVDLNLSVLDSQEKDPVKLEKMKVEWKLHTAANPHFDEMMAAAMRFFREKVSGGQKIK
jgi:pimeloyl-ACP methyl ester carboxylesterase